MAFAEVSARSPIWLEVFDQQRTCPDTRESPAEAFDHVPLANGLAVAEGATSAQRGSVAIIASPVVPGEATRIAPNHSTLTAGTFIVVNVLLAVVIAPLTSAAGGVDH